MEDLGAGEQKLFKVWRGRRGRRSEGRILRQKLGGGVLVSACCAYAANENAGEEVKPGPRGAMMSRDVTPVDCSG